MNLYALALGPFYLAWAVFVSTPLVSLARAIGRARATGGAR